MDLVTFPTSRGGRVLALGQPVDPVVEQQDRQVHVAAQRVDQVVAADRQRVAVAGDHPHRQVRPGGGQAGRDRRRAAVDRVHPVGVHVVREARGAADPGDDDHVLAGDAEAGQEALDGVEDDVVTAAGAPAHLLVGLEVLRLQLGLLRAVRLHRVRDRVGDRALGRACPVRTCGHSASSGRVGGERGAGWCESMTSWITAASSAARKGSPRTWVWLSTSTRYFARSSSDELAEVHLRADHPVVAGAGCRRGRPASG